MKQMHVFSRALTLCLVCVFVAASCGSNPDETSGTNTYPNGTDTSETDSTSVTESGCAVSGIVTRSIEPDISRGGDARGTLYLFLADECGHNAGGAAVEIASLTLKGIDMSDSKAAIAFTFDGIPDGTYQLNGFLDDVASATENPGYPGAGDLVSFGEIAPKCTPVIVSGRDLNGVTLDLNFIMPFDLPGTDSAPDTETVDTSSVSDDGNTYAVEGVVTRTVAPGLGGDGRGDLYMLISTTCMSSGGDPTDLVAFAVFEDADLSEKGSSTPFRLEGVPNGVYQLNGFLDDVTNATADSPYPGKGDLVSFGGVGPKCQTVRVEGADLGDVTFKLNMVMPFDL